MEEIVTTSYQLPTHEHSEMIVHYAIHYFRKEGFFVNKMELDTSVFQIRKGEVFITFFYHPVQIVFKTAKENVVFVETIVTEAFYKLYDTINTLKSFKPRDMRAIISPGIEMKRSTDIAQILQPENIIVRLKSKDKERAIAELVNKLAETGKIKNKTYVLEQVMKREHIMSTGMQKGFACPHCRIEEIDNVKMALGISKEGIEFDTLDDLPAKVIFLVILPTKDVKRHTAVMSHISAMLHREGAITHLTRLQTPKEILAFFKRT